MQAELEPPKPTKEFHEAYLEIYGKKKKTEEGKGGALAELGLALEIPAGKKESESDKENKKQLELDLAALDIPPIKGKDLQIMDMPKINLEIKTEESKKGIMSRLFSKKAKEEVKQEISGLDIASLKMPLLSDLESNKVDMMDMPPPKLQSMEKERLPALDRMEIESPKEEVKEITKKQSPLKIFSRAEKKEPKIAMPSSHDFLAEIKFGARKKEEAPSFATPAKPKKEEKPTIRMPSFSAPEKYPLFDERAETFFEKTTMKTGARDMQVAYEKKHPHETGGFEFLEKIKPLEKTEAGKDFTIMAEEAEEFAAPKIEIPKQLSLQVLKKFKKEVQAYEVRIKKAKTNLKKKESDAQVWIKKQAMQEKKINEKTQKMQQMERELAEKQKTVAQYEPQLRELERKQDEMLAKERELKARQEDVHETEVRVQNEENAIIAKIKKLEADQKLLEKEQDAIQKTVNKLDKERVQISAKTKEFANIVKKIEDSERALKEKAQDIDEREERMRRKEKLIETEFARIQKLKKTAERLKDVEETYARMRERLRLAYKEYEEKFSNQQVYGKPEGRQEQAIRPMPLVATYQAPMHKEPAIDTGDITNSITATKQMIMDKHYDEANKNINRLMQRYVKIPDSNPRKKEIYYEILGLKNMLKLDLLE